MKKRVFVLCFIIGQQIVTKAQQDTIINRNLEEIVVRSALICDGAPMSQNIVGHDKLEQNNFGQDVPYLISSTPSVIVTSDAGTGIGYTSFRVRGTGDNRINVTTNGVPLNDSESQNVFWVNMPDFASSVGEVQIQRGVGTSTNGAGAFGASIAMATEKPSLTPYFEVSESAGSFATTKTTLKGGTGLLNDLFAFDARYSIIKSDGYIDRAKADVSSFYGSATYYCTNSIIRLLIFGNSEVTNQAWNYVPSCYIKAGNRTYNSCGEYVENGVTKYYDQTDNFWQQNYHLSLTHSFNSKFGISLTLHYTHGKGYYEDYKANAKMKNFALTPFVDAEGMTINKTDLIRRKWNRNDFYGFVFKADYRSEKIDAIIGAAANNFIGDHFGNVIWARNYNNLSPNYKYYDNTGKKLDYNFYAKGTFAIIDGLNCYADIQYRGINYTINGIVDKMGNMNLDKHFDFFNPKFGFTYTCNANQAYASFAIGHREPCRDNYTESPSEQPSFETLYDYEIGYSHTTKHWSTAISLYYMDYDNQLIQTGRLSEIGESLTSNIKNSYRTGIEISGSVELANWFNWQANITLSENKIRNFSEYVSTYDANWNEMEPTIVEYEKTDIAFSPSLTANNSFIFNVGNFDANINTIIVSRQYLDNSACKERSIDGYCVSNAILSYTFNPSFAKEIKFGVCFNNIFNEKYETSGWVDSYVVEGESTIDNRTIDDGLAVQATTNFMATLKIRF